MNENEKRWDNLLTSLFDDDATPEALEELARQAKADSAARRELCEQLRLAEALRILHRDPHEGDLFAAALQTRVDATEGRFEFLHRVIDRTEVRARSYVVGTTVAAGVAVAALAATVVLAFVLWSADRARLAPSAPATTQSDDRLPLNADSTTPFVMPSDDSVAIVRRAIGLESMEMSLRVGDALHPNTRVDIPAGTVQIHFYRGALLTLEGPGELEIQDANNATLHAGKAWAYVPPPAIGFTLHTPDAEVVDLGTEFGVEVHPGERTKVSVFEGEVEVYEPLTERAVESRVELKTGEGMEFRPAQNPVPIAVDRERFITDDALRTRQEAQTTKRFEAWQAWSREIRRDPRLLIYYDFARDPASEMSLRDRRTLSTGSGGGVDGLIVGCQWSAGRWPGQTSLEFKRPGDRVRFTLPGEYRAITLAAWVRVDGLDRAHSSLLLTDGWDPGEAHWQFDRWGQLGLAIEGTCNLYTAPLVDLTGLGKWMHVASTYNADTGTVCQYFNGQRVQKIVSSQPAAVKFGAAELGNWARPIGDDPEKYIRSFNGRFDEFLLFNEALSDEEIAQLYSIGVPE